MNRLILEYVLEGHRRGYDFTSPTHNFDDDVLKSIWRKAMPRGQGWGNTVYEGARSIKAFPLPDGRVAVSEVTVTDMVDENGRRGIRRAVIDVMTKRLLGHHLNSRLAGYPDEIRTHARQKHDSIVSMSPRIKNNQPILITLAYKSNQESWWLVEALILMLAVSPPASLRRLARREMITFTTLALDYRNESMFVGIPAQNTIDITIPVIDIS